MSALSHAKTQVHEFLRDYEWKGESTGPLLTTLEQLLEPWRDSAEVGTRRKISGSPIASNPEASMLLADIRSGIRDLEDALRWVMFSGTKQRRPDSDEHTEAAFTSVLTLIQHALDRSSSQHTHGEKDSRAAACAYAAVAEKALREISSWHHKARGIVEGYYKAKEDIQTGACHLCEKGTIAVNPWNVDEAKCVSCNATWSYSAGEWNRLGGAA